MGKKRHPYNDNKIAVAYYRYSSSSQNEKSIEQQRELAHRWADSQGLTIAFEYDDYAKTGRNMKRPGLQKLFAELDTIKPAYLIAWKNDCLGRSRADLMEIKRQVRDAGVRIHYIDGTNPGEGADSVIIEAISDGFAEYYSVYLSDNITRGIEFNAERGLACGRKIFGYMVGPDKRYVEDPQTAPFVTQVFDDYARGASMQKICDRLNAEGMRTVNDCKFTPKGLNKMLKNRAYIGEYSYAGFIVSRAMPRLVADDVFEQVQKRFAVNKRLGAMTKAQLADMGDAAPDYWLTGHLYCECCGSTMQGVSGTSKTGRKYFYYYCKNQRAKQCTMRQVRKEELEARVAQIIEGFLDDTEILASLAVDLADHYKQTHGRQDAILEGLEERRRDVENKLANFVKAIGMGIFNEDT